MIWYRQVLYVLHLFIIAALRSRCWHSISPLWFLLFFFLFFSSSILSGCRLDVYHISTHGVALVRIYNARLKCLLHATRWKYRTQKLRKKIAICAPSHNIVGRAISSQLRHVSTIGQTITVKQQYLLHNFSECRERRSTNGWDRFGSLGHPSKFQRVSSLGSVTAPTSCNGSQPNFARCLAISRAGTLYIHFWELCP